MKPPKGTRKADQHRRTASRRLARLAANPRRWLKRSHVMRHVGAVTRRYLKARAAFLLDRLTAGRCSCDGCGKPSGLIGVPALGRVEPRAYLPPGFHVHHVAKRSTHPELREVQGNLQLLCADCHAKIHSEEAKP